MFGKSITAGIASCSPLLKRTLLSCVCDRLSARHVTPSLASAHLTTNSCLCARLCTPHGAHLAGVEGKEGAQAGVQGLQLPRVRQALVAVWHGGQQRSYSRLIVSHAIWGRHICHLNSFVIHRLTYSLKSGRGKVRWSCCRCYRDPICTQTDGLSMQSRAHVASGYLSGACNNQSSPTALACC